MLHFFLLVEVLVILHFLLLVEVLIILLFLLLVEVLVILLFFLLVEVLEILHFFLFVEVLEIFPLLIQAPFSLPHLSQHMSYCIVVSFQVAVANFSKKHYLIHYLYHQAELLELLNLITIPKMTSQNNILYSSLRSKVIKGREKSW